MPRGVERGEGLWYNTGMRYGLIVAILAVASVAMADNPMPGNGPGVNGARYATDAYPGFDNEESILKPERKEPRWFSFINGPKRDNARDQLVYCTELIKEGDYSKACKQLDALVREWPTAPEAAKAQRALAELTLRKLEDAEDAFREYRYLLDFYSLQCDYAKMADELYKIAGLLKIEGKEIMFVRFENTVDVRRAFEACVLHAPGAKWAPEALLTIASLREADGKYPEAIQVYENLRNLYPASDEAKTAILREAEVRMSLLREREYNRSRCRDTIDFLKLALRTCRPVDAMRIRECLEEASAMMENEAYLGTKFYDSNTRTRRSAISAYERYLSDYPEGAHADEVRERLSVLKGMEK